MAPPGNPPVFEQRRGGRHARLASLRIASLCVLRASANSALSTALSAARRPEAVSPASLTWTGGIFGCRSSLFSRPWGPISGPVRGSLSPDIPVLVPPLRTRLCTGLKINRLCCKDAETSGFFATGVRNYTFWLTFPDPSRGDRPASPYTRMGCFTHSLIRPQSYPQGLAQLRGNGSRLATRCSRMR